jgi:hypothetical protein
MKPSLKSLASFFSSLSLFTISLSISSPVKAALPCEGGTINRYDNGSIASCNIYNNVYISVGALAFSCKQGKYIYFDEKANFNSCILSTPMVIRTGNKVETCSEEFKIYVSIYGGNQSVSCHR